MNKWCPLSIAPSAAIISGEAWRANDHSVMKNSEVMKENKTVRKTRLNLRLNEKEEKRLFDLYRKTTCRTVSEYARRVLLNQPVCIRYRNQSADDFLAEMIQLKNDLNGISHNFTQAFQKLPATGQDPQVKAWLIVHESQKTLLFKKVDEIKEKLSQIYMLWSQK